jgi:hypothetical protein
MQKLIENNNNNKEKKKKIKIVLGNYQLNYQSRIKSLSIKNSSHCNWTSGKQVQVASA